MGKAHKETAPVAVDMPTYTARVIDLGDNFTVAFETIREDRDTSPIFKGLPDDRCPCPHWGLVVSGNMTLRYADHDETFEAGDVYYSPAGHLPFCTAGTELITFSPTDEINKVNAVIARNMAHLAPQA
ncbi:MAG: cupin domain-containing protein [Candidatus Dormibacteria bacterium]